MAVQGEPQDLDDVAWRSTFEQIIRVFIDPEVKRRQEAGTLPTDRLHLSKAQVIFRDFGDAEIRLNDEVRAKAIMRLKPEYVGTLSAGDPVYDHQCDGIVHLELTDHDGPDTGHITIVTHGSEIFLAFDARRNRGKAAALLEKAREFLALAETAYANGAWTGAVDNLYSAAELSVKAILWTGPFGYDFSDRMPHGPIHERFQKFADLGNIGARQRKTFNELVQKRPEMRYRVGSKKPRRALAKRWLEDTRLLLRQAETAIASSAEADGAAITVPVEMATTIDSPG